MFPEDLGWEPHIFHRPSHCHWTVPPGKLLMGHHPSLFFSFLWCLRTYTFRLTSRTCSDSIPTPISILLGLKGVSGALWWRKVPPPMTSSSSDFGLFSRPQPAGWGRFWQGQHSQRMCALLPAATVEQQTFPCLRLYAARVRALRYSSTSPQQITHTQDSNLHLIITTILFAFLVLEASTNLDTVWWCSDTQRFSTLAVQWKRLGASGASDARVPLAEILIEWVWDEVFKSPPGDSDCSQGWDPPM